MLKSFIYEFVSKNLICYSVIESFNECKIYKNPHFDVLIINESQFKSNFKSKNLIATILKFY